MGFTHTPKKTKTPRREMKRVTKKKEKTTHRASQTGTAQRSFKRRGAATERCSETRGHPETQRCELHNPKTGPGIKNAGLEAGLCSQQQMQVSLARRGAWRVAAPPSGKTDPLKPSTPYATLWRSEMARYEALSSFLSRLVGRGEKNEEVDKVKLCNIGQPVAGKQGKLGLKRRPPEPKKDVRNEKKKTSRTQFPKRKLKTTRSKA